MIRKQSKQRDIVLNYMKQVDGHVCAESVFNGLKQLGKNVSLATVYRNLNVLVEMNEIKKIAHPKYGYVYDKTCVPHHHLYCVKCENLIDFPYPYQENFHKEVGKQMGVTLFNHSIIFEGVCEKCNKQSKKHS